MLSFRAVKNQALPGAGAGFRNTERVGVEIGGTFIDLVWCRAQQPSHHDEPSISQGLES
jgi:hypothetical protein